MFVDLTEEQVKNRLSENLYGSVERYRGGEKLGWFRKRLGFIRVRK